MNKCKCCSSLTQFFGEIDSSRTCHDKSNQPFSPSGHLITYYRCPSCGFIFTDNYDELSDTEMQAQIYNDEYILADPDFVGSRPRLIAKILNNLLLGSKAPHTIDYGGGSGTLKDMLTQQGMPNICTYDPYFSKQPKPNFRADLVLAFEVVEHTRNPVLTFSELGSLMQPDGVCIFSTQLADENTPTTWSYIAPRNGHVSIYTLNALKKLLAKQDLQILPGTFFYAYRCSKSLLLGLLLRNDYRSIIYQASNCGFKEMLRTFKIFYLHNEWRHFLRPGPWLRSIISELRTS